MMPSCVITALAMVVVGVACAQFVDDFSGPELNSRWEWRTPKAGPTWSLADSPGNLRITLPKVERGFNHWVGDYGADAPLLLADAPDSDFDLEAHLRVVFQGPDSNYHLALVVAFSPRYLVGWGPFFAPGLGTSGERPETWAEPTGQGRYLADTGDGRDVFVRIERTGREYAFRLRRSLEEPWTLVGTWTSAWPAWKIGFMGKTFGNGGPVVADIDYIRLDLRAGGPPVAPEAVISVDCAGPTWSLDPMRLGHFIEHLDGCIYGGIWAELLHNRKFTGAVSPQGAVEGWEAVGLREGVELAADNVDYYCPSQSQRITVRTAGQPAGIGQRNLTLRGGVAYRVRLVARQEGPGAPVRVTLQSARPEGPTVISHSEIADIGVGWTTRELELAGPPETMDTMLTITTGGPGTLWLGAVSLMPADAVDGIRADVLEAIREIRPPVVRWPGGNFVSGYDWRDGIGPRDRRPARWDRAWNAWEWNDFGTDEFLRFCELVGTTPYICVNCGEGMAPEAAAWVEYCNGAADSTWGKVRAANGRREPYRVSIWGIGNEMYGQWQLGHLNATRYGLKAIEFARAMREVDPTIRLVGVGVDGDGWGGWNREVCRIAGRHFDWLSVHYYLGLPDGDPVLNYAQALGAPAQAEQMLEATYSIAREASGKALPLAFDEWNIWLPTREYTLRDGLFACSIFNALNRLGDKCPMANLAQLVNVLGAIFTDPTRTVRTPIHQAFRLYTDYGGPLGVAVRMRSPEVEFPSGRLPALDVSASLSEDRRILYLAAVNRMPAEAVIGRLELDGLEPGSQVEVVTLTAPTPETANTLERPDAVALEQQLISLERALRYSYPAHSATVLVFREP